MIDAFLVPEKTVITVKGDSAALDVSSSANRTFLLTFSINGVVEQESIEVSIFTSADGTTWDAKPVVTLPQKFYVGDYPILVDLTATPDARFVRAHWEVNRWGRGPNNARFEVSMRLREIPPDLLHEARAEALSLR